MEKFCHLRKTDMDNTGRMKLTHKFNYRGEHLSRILNLCKASKDLYNQAQYIVRKSFIESGTYIDDYKVDKIMKETVNLEGEINYRKLKAKVAQQTLKVLDSDWKSFFALIKDWRTNPLKYKKKPNLPSYKRGDHYNLYYSNQSFNVRLIKGVTYLMLSKDLYVKIPQPERIKGKLFQCRVIPKKRYVNIEIVYESEINNTVLDSNNYLSIDLGVNRIASCIDTLGNAFMFNGLHIKSYNKFFNKRLSKLKSQLPIYNFKGRVRQRSTSKLIETLYSKRNNFMNDKMHKISRLIIDHCLANDIGNIVIGQNKGWKNESSMSNKTNQTFCQIPHSKLIDIIKYKSELNGIKLILTEESYTSKCDSLALEPIQKHENYLGKRTKRGLFKSSIGVTINADINGAINILRKVVGDSVVRPIINIGRLYRPSVWLEKAII